MSKQIVFIAYAAYDMRDTISLIRLCLNDMSHMTNLVKDIKLI